MTDKKTKSGAKETAGRYSEAFGGRKTARARVRLRRGAEGVTVSINGRDCNLYFPNVRARETALSPLKLLKIENVSVTARVKGGGVFAQAEAVRHGLARALAGEDAENKRKLRRAGFLTRDSRMVERKKYGLKKARRAPQWSKR